MDYYKIYNLVKILFDDIQKGSKVLSEKGISRFIYRFYWYLKGERKTDNIEQNRIRKSSKILASATFDSTTPIVFLKQDFPLVTIIIPVHNQWDYTYRCLKSIHLNTSETVKYEVVLIDDCSTDDTRNIGKIIKNISLIINESNLGFLLSCNKASKLAKGKYIHFLNNDTYVHPNWLSSLVKLIENDDRTGIVGSKLIYPNGKLQEAGGIVWHDASGMNYGKYDDPDKSEYNYVKEVDYVSGASMLIKKDLWEQLNGFDERYIPAYYEDTDLAYSIRALGYKIQYQPLSVVTHFEGVSNGLEANSGIKKHQVSNRSKFYNKWETILGSENNNIDSIFTCRDRSTNKKHILIIDHKVPHFDQDAGSKSTFSYIKLFLKLGYSVTFFGDNFYQHEPYTSTMQQLGVEVLYGSFYRRNIKQWLQQFGRYFDIIITHRMLIAPKYLKYIREFSKAKVVYVGHDLEFEKSRKKYELTGNNKIKKEFERIRNIEQKIFDQVDIILPFSTHEKGIIQKMAPDKIVKEIPVFFYEDQFKKVNDFSNRNNLLFVGSFSHPPNVEGLHWFLNEIFPKVLSKIKGCKLNIIGADPPDDIKAYSSESINIVGFVSNLELEQYYQSSKLSVIPLRYGAGVKGKLIETMYYQLPTVITSVAAEGIPEIDDNVLIADDSVLFADHIYSLFTNQKLWEDYSARGRNVIEKHFSEQTAIKKIADILEVDELS